MISPDTRQNQFVYTVGGAARGNAEPSWESLQFTAATSDQSRPSAEEVVPNAISQQDNNTGFGSTVHLVLPPCTLPIPERLTPEQTPVTSPSSSSATSSGFEARFFEARHHTQDLELVERAARAGVIDYLGMTSEQDEFFDLREGIGQLPAGVYRIRMIESGTCVLTHKTPPRQAGGQATTVDFVDPGEEMLASVRTNGELIAVVRKERKTYASRTHSFCHLHVDVVDGLGTFIDVKASTEIDLARFESDLGLSRANAISESYLDLARQKGQTPLQLKMWRLQQTFSDYILGVVSGTLTPLGFLTVTALSGGTPAQQIISLLSAGVCDGISDSVAAGQATQSDSRASWTQQIAMFSKTMAGKVLIPITFIPTVVVASSATQTCALATGWALSLLASTSAIQAIANGKSVAREVSKSAGFGLAAASVGAVLGQTLPPVLSKLLSWF